MRFVIAVAILGGAILAQNKGPLLLGKKFDGVKLVDRQSQPAQPPSAGLKLLMRIEDCSAPAGQSDAAAKLKVEIVSVVAAGPSACRESAALFNPDRTMPRAVLVENGAVRRIIREGDAFAEVALWRSGREIYEPLCVRCHGTDGTDTGYFGVKSLAGIGNRVSEPRIYELTAATGAVDLNTLTERDRRALSAYVAGF
jgi:mono/diheme cytochrome c family protein